MEIDINTLIAYYRLQLKQPELLGNVLRNYLGQYFEEPPATFSYNGRGWTPKEFAETIVKGSQAPTDLVQINAEDLGLPKFLATVAAHMKKFSEPVVMSMIWDSSFYDGINALMTISGFATYLGANQNSANAGAMWHIARELAPKTGAHAVLAWDFAVDETDQNITSILALNSWGKTWGDQGYVHIFESYLKHAKPSALVDRSVLPR